MKDFWFFIGMFTFTLAVCAVWVMGKVVFERWLNNDWCRHDWGKWKDGLDSTDQSLVSQGRWCTKCNKMENRRL